MKTVITMMTKTPRRMNAALCNSESLWIQYIVCSASHRYCLSEFMQMRADMPMLVEEEPAREKWSVEVKT